MQKTHDIEIFEEDIFKNDLLDRKSEIENLTPLVLNFNDPLVLALDSPWGTGKTTFVKLWQAHLKQQGNQAIYFNAWETDFAEDPLIVLVSELNKWLKSCNESVASTFIEKSKKVLPSIAKQTAIGLTKALTLIAVDSQEVERVISEAMGNITGDLIDNFNKQSEAIQQFKKIIEEALKALPDEQKNLVIFIDELDRCRPTYAIELLERIKHLFSIERLVFVLSTDTTQLSHSVCAVYGNNFDAKKYLQRFIDLDYSLKNPNMERYIEAQLNHLKINDYLKERRTKHHDFQYEKENFTKFCFLLIQRFSLKLRDINLLLMRIRLILCSIPINHYLYEVPLITILMLREYNKELYVQYINSPIIANKVIEYLIPAPTKKDENNYAAGIIAYLIAPNENEDFERLLKPYKEAIVDDSIYSSDFNNHVCKIANHLKNHYDKSFDKRSLGLIIERIELLHRINL
jgi:Cdc6-like AAA superfamily ATPase